MLLVVKLFSVYGSVEASLVEKKSKEVLEMRVSVGKELIECGIFTLWRRDRERHEGAVSLMILSIFLTYDMDMNVFLLIVAVIWSYC